MNLHRNRFEEQAPGFRFFVRLLPRSAYRKFPGTNVPDSEFLALVSFENGALLDSHNFRNSLSESDLRGYGGLVTELQLLFMFFAC
jgi:hypothetical protein